MTHITVQPYLCRCGSRRGNFVVAALVHDTRMHNVGPRACVFRDTVCKLRLHKGSSTLDTLTMAARQKASFALGLAQKSLFRAWWQCTLSLGAAV